jgi:peptide/nickel transport system substrate-binding protein
MTSHAQWRRAAALFFVSIFLLTAACSDDPEPTSGPDGTDQAEASDIDPNGVMKVGYDLVQSGTSMVNLDPLTAESGNPGQDPIYYLVYGRFVKPTPDGDLTPDLAESAEVVDSATIDIVLRDGLTFSDGTPFDAAAVKASFDAVLGAKAVNEPAYQAPFFDLTTVTVVDPTTVRLGIEDGKAASWYDAYMPTWAVSVIKASGHDPITPIGAGPYTVAEHKKGESLILQKNPSYWNADAVLIERIEFVPVPFATAQQGIAALQTGEVDSTFTEPSLIATLGSGLESFARTSATNSVSVHMCKREGPLSDARVRIAINKALDREAISDAVYFGTAEPSTQMWPTGHRLNVPELDDDLAYDPAGARQLLQEAGYGNGFSIDLFPIQAFNLDETAEVMQSQLKDVGITVNIVPTTDYVGQFLNSNLPAMGLYPNNAAGVAKLNTWTGQGIGNVCRYDDPELNTVVNEIKGVSESSDEAVELWADAADIVVGDALNGFVVWRSQLAAYNPERLGDYQPLPLGNYIVPDPFVTYVKANS